MNSGRCFRPGQSATIGGTYEFHISVLIAPLWFSFALMSFTKIEANVLLLLAVSSTSARPASVEALKSNRQLFHRPSDGERILRHLARNGFIAPCSEWPNIYLLQSPIAAALGAAACTAQGHFAQHDSMGRALAEVHSASGPAPSVECRVSSVECVMPSPPGAESARVAAVSAPQLHDHLVTAEKKSFSQLPSEQVTSECRVLAPQIIALLERTIRASKDPERLALWEEWAGWWVVVARNNPDRIERAYEKAQRQPGGVRYLERYMRKQISTAVREGLG